MLKCSVFRRFLRVERIVDTVGVCGSNPHAPTISIQQNRKIRRLFAVAVDPKTIQSILAVRALVIVVSEGRPKTHPDPYAAS
jgi:hypothetical protein